MAFTAYRDPERTILINANECTINDRPYEFYCLNPKCSAKLKLRAVNSIIHAHFYAISPHQGWCSNEHKIFDATQYDESKFQFDKFINRLLESPSNGVQTKSIAASHPKGDGKVRPISSLAQLYTMCKSYDYNHLYNGTPVWKILFDDRCNFIISKGIIGTHLVECIYDYVRKKQQCIYFKYPINPRLKNKYTIRLNFSDAKIFDICTYKIKNKEMYPIVVVGNWEKYYTNCYQCNIVSGSQIYWTHP